MKKLKIITILFILITIFGCHDNTKYMSNDEVINQTKYCESSGLRAKALSNLSGKVYFIQCVPQETCKKE